MQPLFHLERREPDQDNEFYTPAIYVDAARTVMSRIDLDPASCELANKIVKASSYYTQADNGLIQPWHGCLWLNPPYGTTGQSDRYHRSTGKSYIRLFSEKLLDCYNTGKIEQAVFMARADPSARWFAPLWSYPICFLSGDVFFHRPNGELKDHRFGSCFVYFGPHEQKFIEIFSQLGRVVKAIDSQRSSAQSLKLWNEE